VSESVFFAPVKVFQSAFDSPDVSSALSVVLLTGLFLAAAVFLVLGDVVSIIFSFVSNLIQWIVFSALVWFFEFVHVRRRKRMSGTSFSQCLSVVGKLWLINFVLSVLFFAVALAFLLLGEELFFIAGAVFVLASIALVIFWIIASFKLLKVVFGVERGKLFVNWVILNIVNGLTVGFVLMLLARLPLF
jgi:hypothetical protein